MGIVYLIHLEEKYKHAQHYIGYTAGPMYKRMRAHRTGTGSKMLRAVNRAGIGYEVTRKWANGSRVLERKLKKQTRAKMLCPVCNPKIRTKYKYYVVTKTKNLCS